MINPERNLFIAILNRLALDAIGVGAVDRWHDAKAVIEAREYIENSPPDFRHIAELAGFDPAYVSERIKAQIARLNAEGVKSKGQKRWRIPAEHS